MKQASFQIGNSVNKEKNNVSEYITNVPKEVNVQKENNKNTITNNKPRKLVENIYYF
jgi:hypothetical protein